MEHSKSIVSLLNKGENMEPKLPVSIGKNVSIMITYIVRSPVTNFMFQIRV